MLKFLWRRNKQQSDPARDEESINTDQEQPVNYLEDVLKPLFERINPTAPEEYAGMCSINVIIICTSRK